MSPRSSSLRRLVLGLLVATGVLAGAELLARLLTGPPAMRIVLTMPDGRPGTMVATDAQGRVVPADPAQRSWWPADPAVHDRPRVVWLGGSSLAMIGEERITASIVGEALGVETVNLAMGGADTGHIVATLPLVEALVPDVVVVYTGHNDLGNATMARYYADPAAVRIARTRAVLGRSRLFGLLEQRLGTGAVTRALNPRYDDVGAGMDDAQRSAALYDYAHRLRQIVQGAQATGAHVVLSTVVSDATFPSARSWCPEQVEAVGVHLSGMQTPPLDRLDRDALARARVDTPCWDLDYLDALARHSQDGGAVEELLALRDHDPGPSRGGRPTNTIVRRVAAETGATLVDTAAAFQARGGGLEPPAWFRDSVHLSAEGHQALAASLAPAIAAETGASGTVAWPAP